MHVIGSWFSLGFFECQDVNFESKLHKYVSCFKLTVLKIGTFYMIWMFWCYLLVFFQTYLVMVVWLVRMKKTCFRGKNNISCGGFIVDRFIFRAVVEFKR